MHGGVISEKLVVKLVKLVKPNNNSGGIQRAQASSSARALDSRASSREGR
jgi:hypothetical protein